MCAGQRGQIMDLATRNNERFVVDPRGEPAVVIMSVQDFIRTVVPTSPMSVKSDNPGPARLCWDLPEDTSCSPHG